MLYKARVDFLVYARVYHLVFVWLAMGPFIKETKNEIFRPLPPGHKVSKNFSHLNNGRHLLRLIPYYIAEKPTH